jgi:16S rRNA (adenine1518-N6/adenine1519-N6)-dimethyltransferase
MHTKKQIQQFLRAYSVNPDKRLGQNFLIDLNLMGVLLETAGIRPEDTVLEVGCGTGSFTEELAKTGACVIGVEIDEEFFKIAESVTSDFENVTLVKDDILARKSQLSAKVSSVLESALEKLEGDFILAANLPYQVACPLILNLVTGQPGIDKMFVTVQKEVAYRLTAAPGDEHYGILSVLLAATGDAKIERILKPGVFWPAPKVDSAFVSYRKNPEKIRRIKDMELLKQLVSIIINHRRKMVKSCIKYATGRLEGIDNWEALFEEAGIDPRHRPHQLSPEDYVNLANIVCEYLQSI